MKYIGNFFSLPNEIFLLGLSPGELAVYCYLRRCENQKTHQCWPSYKTIGEAVGKFFLPYFAPPEAGQRQRRTPL